jgi:hypothetical protein
MSALTILIIRHAEKPGENWPGPGLTEDGEKDKESLVIRGWQRAGAWAALFGAGLGGTHYPAPQVIYAAKLGASDDLIDGLSRRPAETIWALAPRLGLMPIESIAKGEEEKLVEQVLERSGVVLVSWEHNAIISDILPRIPVIKDSQLPAHWPGQRFDVVLRFDRAEGAAEFSFCQLFPKLLWGDSDKPLGAA